MQLDRRSDVGQQVPFFHCSGLAVPAGRCASTGPRECNSTQNRNNRKTIKITSHFQHREKQNRNRNNKSFIIYIPQVRRADARSQLSMTRWIFDSLVETGALVNRNALAERIQCLTVWTITALDALSTAFLVERDVVAGPRAAVPAHLVRLTAVTVNTYEG